VISVREVPEPGQMDAYEDGLLLPVPGRTSDSIELERRDGRDIKHATASELSVVLGKQTVTKVEETRVQVIVTDARVALACSKYHKGFGGGIITGSASRMLAVSRRHGKMLVGQVRYPWLNKVGSKTKFGWTTNERLMLVFHTSDGAMAYGMNLPGDTDAAAIAAEIVRRAAAYRLACEPGLEPEVCARLRDLADAQRIEPDPSKPDKASWFELPAPWMVGEESARFEPGKTGGDAGAARPPADVAPEVADATPQPESSEPAVAAAKPRFCTHCGATVAADDAFCGSCGSRLRALESTT